MLKEKGYVSNKIRTFLPCKLQRQDSLAKTMAQQLTLVKKLFRL